MKFKKVAVVLLTTIVLIACKNKAKSSKETEAKEALEVVEVDTPNETKTISDRYGNYVSVDYDKRNEGYDWVSVAVTDAGNNQLNIKGRSRADKKKPTCTFDATVQKWNDSTYTTTIQDKKVLFTFNTNTISIATENEEDSNLLYFYCAGGASLAGAYTKIDEPVDQSQVDQTLFSKTLNLQDIGFHISSTKNNDTNMLTVFTFGLPYEFNETFNIGNQLVTNAEVEDLDSDGSPDLVVFTKNDGPNQKAMIHAFSTNNKKSMSKVYFPPTEDNKEINKGYIGHNEFALIENNLVQRFPIFKNKEDTGKIRQVQYQLVYGEASKRFEVKNVDEY